MKKFLSLISILFITCFMGVLSVSASEEMNLTGDNIKGKLIRVSIKGAEGRALIYDNKSVVCNNTECFSAAFYGDSGRKISSNDITFEFKINASENKILNFKIVPTDGGTGTIVEKEYEINPVNKTSATKPSEETTTKPVTEATKSNNANLKTLVVKTNDDSIVELTPSFSASVTEYNATVPGSVKAINIETTMEDSKATVILSKNATEELIPGENNKIIITVTAEDGTKRAYTLNIKREALTADATLKSLVIKESKNAIKESLTPSNFKLIEDKYTYTVKVNNSVKQLTLDIETKDDTATYEIEGNENLKDGSAVKITVTAEDGTKKVYTLNISKVSTTVKNKVNVEAEKNPLIIMGLSIIAFGLIGGIIYVIKK